MVQPHSVHLLGFLHLEDHLGGRALQVGLQRRAILPPMFDGRIWQKHAETSDVENIEYIYIAYIYIYSLYIYILYLYINTIIDIFLHKVLVYIHEQKILKKVHMIQPHMYIYIYI